MRNAEDLDRRFRDEARQLKTAPVSWQQIAKQRRRQRLGVLIVAMIALTVALAMLVIAGRTALDPTYHPPIVSRSNVSAEVTEPKLGREAITRAAFLAKAHKPTVPSEIAGRRGYMFNIEIEASGLEGEAMVGQLRLRRAGARWAPHRGPGVEQRLMPPSGGEAVALRTWAPKPRRSGRYVGEVQLIGADGERLARARSEAFYVVADDCCTPYVAPSYRARVPRGWAVERDYAPAPGARFLTELSGPGGLSILIDTTPHSHGDASESQRVLEETLRTGSERYRRLRVTDRRFGPSEVVEWTYRSARRYYTDELFYREGGGYAVLCQSELSRVREAREFCRAVSRSVRGNAKGRG